MTGSAARRRGASYDVWRDETRADALWAEGRRQAERVESRPGGIPPRPKDGRLYHGGVPGLRPGDHIEPGHAQTKIWDPARGAQPDRLGAPYYGGPLRPECVYVTPLRSYAAYFADTYPLGDLYQVKPDGPLSQSEFDDDSAESYTAPRARVVAVLDRAVHLTPTELRRFAREAVESFHEQWEGLVEDPVRTWGELASWQESVRTGEGDE